MMKPKKNYDSQPSGQGNNILLGITGSIAAYKAAYLTRLLVKEGYDVRIVMTRAAAGFISPLTLSTLSKNPVLSDFYDADTGNWNNHVELAHWASLLLIAPVTAESMAKFAHGHCDNLLSALYLSAISPVWLAPAMDREMFNHPATQKNLNSLKEHGCNIIAPEDGELASGLFGEGRMAEPDTILQHVKHLLNQENKSLNGKTFLVTAGPTYEAIDPVRFIGNRSSGKMGYALANELAKRGAHVILISGPGNLKSNHPEIELLRVESAREMHDAVFENFARSDGVIMAAAVADYTPEHTAAQKIKKESSKEQEIKLVRTIDILKKLGKEKQNGQLIAGFSLETNEGKANALKKLEEKNIDFIVLNSLEDKGAGFDHETNKITIFDRDGNEKAFPLKDKSLVAVDIIDRIEAFYQ